MARNDDSQRGQGAPSRVYKSSDVHKRRVDRKGRAKKSADAPVPPASDEGASASGPAGAQSASPASGAKPAVVISPEFGRRTQAQRQADDRWFAAMRDADAPAEALAGIGREPDAPKPETGLASEAGSADTTPASPEPGSTAELAPKPSEVEPPASESAGEETPPSEPEPIPGPESQPESESEPESESKRPSVANLLPKKRSRRIVLAVVLVLLIAAVVAACLFAWNRWYRFDDRADMQGTWYAVGTTVPIEIDEASIKLTDDVTYQYEIDAHDKTIRYTFGPMQGQGRYWFSDDRQYLVITDGSDFDGTSTALDDLLHSIGDMGDKVTGADMKLPEGEGIIAFCREPDPEALAREEAEKAAKVKAEEEARKEAERKEAEEAAEWEDSYYEEEYYEEEAPAEEPSDEEPANENE